MTPVEKFALVLCALVIAAIIAIAAVLYLHALTDSANSSYLSIKGYPAVSLVAANTGGKA